MPEAAEKKEEHVSEVRRKAVQARWSQVREDRDEWIRPFHDLRIEKSLEYLDDLQKIWEEGSRIITQRIGSQKDIKCGGPKCGKDLTGIRPNGMPKWVAKKDFNDQAHPGVIQSLYFCSELCNNEWVRKQQGGGGTDGR